MNVKKFVAATSRDALRKVREALGADAVILSNRATEQGVEILALASDDISALAQPAVEPEADVVRELEGVREGMRGGAAAAARRGPARQQEERAEPRFGWGEEDDGEPALPAMHAPLLAQAATYSSTGQGGMVSSMAESLEMARRGSSPAAPLAMPGNRAETFASRARAETVKGVQEAARRDSAPREPVREQPRDVARDAVREPVRDSVPLRESGRDGGRDSAREVRMRAASPLVAEEDLPPARPAARGMMLEASRCESEMAEMRNEIRAMRDLMQTQLAEIAWGATQKREPHKAQVLRELLAGGFSPSLSRFLTEKMPQVANDGQAMQWIRGVLERNIQTLKNEHEVLEKGGVFALVGPTGVGKTTSTAKLAARCVMRHGTDKLALITTDGYRIGGHEQLRIYG